MSDLTDLKQVLFGLCENGSDSQESLARTIYETVADDFRLEISKLNSDCVELNDYIADLETQVAMLKGKLK